MEIYKDRIIKIDKDSGAYDEEMIHVQPKRIGTVLYQTALIVDINTNILREVRIKRDGSTTPVADFNSDKALLIQKYGMPDTEENNDENFGKGLYLCPRVAQMV